jgi:hypothetical protein
MPLARIDLAEGKTADYRRTIGEEVYDALVEVLKAPKGDRIQVHRGSIQSKILSLIPTSWAFRDRETAFFIQLTLNARRAVDQKRAFYKAIADGLHERLSLRRGRRIHLSGRSQQRELVVWQR